MGAAGTASALGTGGIASSLGSGLGAGLSAAGGAASTMGSAAGSVANTAGGYLSKGWQAAKSFAGSPVGKEVISQALQGYQEGKLQEEEWKRQDKILYGGSEADRDEMRRIGDTAGGEYSYR